MSGIKIIGNVVDILKKEVYSGTVTISGKTIISIDNHGSEKKGDPYIIPGFIDSHVHIESSMLIPSEFARLAVVHGTTGTISDPHEIANVCGMKGVQYMIENGNTVPFKFHFGAPSCVPATVFETAGASLNPAEVDELLKQPSIYYLSEMMNFPGVLHNDPEVMQKIASSKKYGKPVDGHAPGLRGADALKYIQAGISTDHECFTAEEALDKLQKGMKILIREGSAAKNFEALILLLDQHYEQMMFCSDDKHPDSLVEGHINVLCARAIAKGNNVFKVLQAACINPVIHYKMKNGLLRAGDPADLVVVKDLVHFAVTSTYIDGALVAENGKSKIDPVHATLINHFACEEKKPSDFSVRYKDETTIPVIEALDGQLITNKIFVKPAVKDGFIISDTGNDVLKIAVVNRYSLAPVAISFIRNIGLTSGAIASSVAHDSHNIVAVGVDDESISRAVNAVISKQGGVSAVSDTEEMVLPLPVAGLMSEKDGYEVAKSYTNIDAMVKRELGSKLSAPFMTLSFMALLVIPHLKLSDKGLFDGDSFSLV